MFKLMSKKVITFYDLALLSIGSTQEGPSQHNWKIVDGT